MEGIIILILLVVGFIIVMPIVASVKAGNANREARKAQEQLHELEARIARQQRKLQELENRLIVGSLPTQDVPEKIKSDRPAAEMAEIPQPSPFPPAKTVPDASPQAEAIAIPGPSNKSKPAPEVAVPPPLPPPQRLERPAFSIEQFLGVKMFAWLGGIALFFGVIFFVKYAFEHSLISPAMRVSLGFITGLGLLGGGLWTHTRKAYRILAQTLCATGVLILYGVTVAAHSVYRFPAFNPGVTFTLMSLITVFAFLISVRLNALIVATLGMLGGFLTPVLLPAVQEHPFALFSYVALLDAGLIAVTWRGRWNFLTSSAAIGTVLTQIGWVTNHFIINRYYEGINTFVPMGVFFFFVAMFVAAARLRTKVGKDESHLPLASTVLLTSALGMAFYYLNFEGITDRTFVLYGYVLLLDLAAIALAWIYPRFQTVQTTAMGAIFLHLIIWTSECLQPSMLGSALVVYLIFGALHSLLPTLRAHLRPSDTSRTLLFTGIWTPPMIVALMALPVIVLPHVSFILWPAVLLADLLVIGIAMAGGAILPVLASLLVTLMVAAVWLFKVPAEVASVSPMVLVVVVCALLFSTAGLWLSKRRTTQTMDAANLLPAAASFMPFSLLILMVLRLPVTNPSLVFGAGTLLLILLLGLTALARQGILALVAVICCLGLELAWHVCRFDPASPMVPLAWYLGFYSVFMAFPFLSRKRGNEHNEPWIASAVGAAGHFVLIHDLIRNTWPNPAMGLLPAAFAVPSILSLLAVLRFKRPMDRITQVRLSWLGGAALLFITLIFPIQFDRQWLTVSWALEGAGLVWLFRRVPHTGLLWTGLALLATSFIRLTINPAVFSAYPRSGNAIFNWHLYAYGVVAIAHFFAAKWFPETYRRLRGLDLVAALWSMGGILLFLLLNIEIADFFTASGKHFITLEFSGNFARDMTYTIAWGLFALALLVLGIRFRSRGARLAAVGLLATTLLKLFLHDLANIGNIYRIAALLATGLIAFLASFLYQRFLSKSPET